MRILSPTSMRWIAASDVLAGVVFGVVAFVNFPGWNSLFGGFMAGACLVAALHTIMLAGAHRIVQQQMEAIEMLTEVNVNLIARLADRDGSPPLSPGGAK